MSDPVSQSFERSGLKPAHILVVLVFCIFAMEFAVRTGANAGWWPRVGHERDLLVRIGAIAIALGMFSCIRAIREAIVAMFRAPSIPLRWTDILLALAVGYSWSLGVHMVAIAMPTMHLDAAYYYSFWGYRETAPAWDPGHWVLLAFSMGVLTPVLEEFFFRGMLLGAWRARRSLIASVLLSSFVFGIIHGRTTVLAFGFGIVFALLFIRYRSLWPGIIVHGVHNVLQVTPGLISFTQEKARSEITSWTAWTTEIALTAAFFPLAYLFWRRFRPG